MDAGKDFLSGKIVLVTGGSGGIGRAICAALATSGAAVIDASVEYLDLAPDICKSQAGISRIGVDVANPASVTALFARIDEYFGQKIDVLINSAGLFLFKPLLEIGPEEWRNVLSVNLDGAFYCSREALLRMTKTGFGQIINIGSIAGQLPLPGNGVYGTSKAALKMLTEMLHTEFAEQGIKASWLALGAVETNLWATSDRKTLEMLQPERVANAVLFIIQQNMEGRLEELCLLPDYRYRL